MKREKNISRMSRLKSARWVCCVDNDVTCTVYRSHEQQHQFTFLQDRNKHICIFCNLNRIKIILNELKRTELKLAVLVTNLPTENWRFCQVKVEAIYPHCTTVYLQIHKKSREDAKKKVEMSSYLKEMEQVWNFGFSFVVLLFGSFKIDVIKLWYICIGNYLIFET